MAFVPAYLILATKKRKLHCSRIFVFLSPCFYLFVLSPCFTFCFLGDQEASSIGEEACRMEDMETAEPDSTTVNSKVTSSFYPYWLFFFSCRIPYRTTPLYNYYWNLDSSFHFNANPDPTFHFYADPGPGLAPLLSYAKLWPLAYWPSTAPIWAFTPPLRASTAFRGFILSL